MIAGHASRLQSLCDLEIFSVLRAERGDLTVLPAEHTHDEGMGAAIVNAIAEGL